jgi:hypothetical protein
MMDTQGTAQSEHHKTRQDGQDGRTRAARVDGLMDRQWMDGVDCAQLWRDVKE